MNLDCRHRFTNEDWICRLRKEVQHRVDLGAGDRWILLGQFDWSEVLQVLEDRRYGHTRATKHPRSADFSGDTFKN